MAHGDGGDTLGFVDFTSGVLGGFVSKTFEYPLDVVKVRLQAQNVLSSGSGDTVVTHKGTVSHRFTGVWDCLSTTVRTEGFMALYKGVSIPLLGTVFDFALMFWVNGRTLQWLGVNNRPPSASEALTAGAFAGFVGSFIWTPLDLAKNRLQVQQLSFADAVAVSTTPSSSPTPHQPYTGVFNVIQRTLRTEGWLGLYRGHTATLAMEIPGTAAWFASYAVLKRHLCSLDHPFFHSINASGERVPSFASTMLAGGTAGALYWIVAYPADTARTEVQTRISPAAGSGAMAQRSGLIHVLQDIYRGSGVRGLYKGMGTAVGRAIPGSAVCFSVYDMTVEMLSAESE